MSYNSYYNPYSPYGTGYPSYQPTYQPVQSPALQASWINGEAGAQAYLLPPNSSVLLMDSDNPVFYIKTSDSSGKASLRVFDYKERSFAVSTPSTAAKTTDNDFITRQEFEAFKASLSEKKKGDNAHEHDPHDELGVTDDERGNVPASRLK